MDNVARIRPSTASTPRTRYFSGVVMDAGTAGSGVRVSADDTEIVCKRAASCLLEAVAGDRVLVFSEGTDAWILGVLDRAEGTASDLVFDGDTTMRTREGTLTLQSPAGIRLESKEEVRMVSSRLRMVVERADIAAQQIVAIGQTIESQWVDVRLHARRLDQFVDHLSQKLRTALRIVEDSDLLRAGRLDHRADGVASIQGKAAVINGEHVVKVDGRQIQLG